MVEQMMLGLDEDSIKNSNSTASEQDQENQNLGKTFKKPIKFSILSSLPSSPDEVKLTEANCTNQKQMKD